jgi:hypothetical protein
VTARHHAPRGCPVCGEQLALTRLSCPSCEVELSGHFAACEFCALEADQRALLRVFLASRGNMKELERHLGVSYPTARARVTALLAALGLDTPEPDDRLSVLQALAEGDIDVDEALGRLADE